MTNDEGVAAMGSNDTRDTVEVARITMPIDALAFAACRDGSAACGEPLLDASRPRTVAWRDG